VVSHLQVLASERCIDLHTDIVPVQVLGDRAQLQQAIVNLVENALRVTPEGDNMHVTVQADATHARVVVSDTGPGFSTEARAHALEPFFSLPGEGTGVGLGLPIARAIARAHGGDLRIGHPPTGAELIIELPRASDG
jgi:signal transduction histidine kinase